MSNWPCTTWGKIIGTLSDQADLQAVLDTIITDHGGLTGLADDDHPQYHNDARGDARYYTQSAADITFAPISHTHTASDITDFDTEVSNNTDVAASKAVTDYITITQAVDLDDIETRVNALDAAVVLKGTWDASSGSFPGGGTAQAGWSYIVSVGGTVDSVAFVANDRILAITDNASTSTYASNWHKLDYTDQVLSVNSQTGAVVLDADDIDDTSTTNKFTTAADISKLAGIESGAEVNNISDTNATDLTDTGDTTLHFHSADRNRANHTGTQAASTISDFSTAADARIAAASIDDLSDVAITTPSHGQVIVYDSVSGGWKNDTIAGGGGGDAWGDPVDDDIIPDTDNTYDLGSSSARFAEIWGYSFNGIALVENTDGFTMTGGSTSERDFTVSGSDIAMVGAGSNTYALPSTAGTLLLRDDAATISNKEINPEDNTIDGDLLDITFTPSSYTPDSSVAEANDADDLAAHLKGIDTAIAAAGGGVKKLKTADQGFTSTTTLADVTDLSFSVVSGTKYKISGILYLFSTSSTPDMQIDVTGPASGYQRIAWNNPSAGDEEVLTAFSTTSARMDIVANTRNVVYLNWYLEAGGNGTVQLRASQATSNGTASTIEKGSNLSIEVIA